MSTDSQRNGNVGTGTIVAEYNSLRDEILKRIELRQQAISITLTIAGIFLGIGVTTDTIALVYPPLAALLAISWVQNETNIRRLSIYIREHLESVTPYLGWETYVQENRKETRMKGWRFMIFSHGGIFIFTQLMAIGVGLLKFTFTPVEWALLGVDVVALLLVVWVTRQAR
jgi:hypothetical protein